MAGQPKTGANVREANGFVGASDSGKPATWPAHRGRFIFMDALNVLSCIAVVALHVSLPVFTPENSTGWLTDVWFQACAIFATPIFFMISGANLLGYRERYSTEVFFVKRFARTGMALLGGSALCYLLFCIRPFGFYGAEPYAAGPSLTDFAKRFFTNSINDTYWFLYSILYLYLLTPLLSLALPNKRLMRYLVALSVVASIGFPLLRYLGVEGTVFSASLSWPLFSDRSLMYFLLGGYIARYHASLKRPRPVALVAAFAASTALMGVWSLAINGYLSGAVTESYDSYPICTASPFCFVQVISLYLLFESCEGRFRNMPQRMCNVLSRLSGASLTVYLIHILLINALPIGKLEAFVNLIHRNIYVELVCVYLLSAAVGMLWVALKKTGNGVLRRK